MQGTKQWQRGMDGRKVRWWAFEVVGIQGGWHSAEDLCLIQIEDTYRSHFLKILFWTKEENLDKAKE